MHIEWIEQLKSKKVDKKKKLVICSCIKHVYMSLPSNFSSSSSTIDVDEESSSLMGNNNNESKNKILIQEVKNNEEQLKDKFIPFTIGVINEDKELKNLILALYHVMRNEGYVY